MNLKFAITIMRWIIAFTLTTISGGIALIIIMLTFGKARNQCVTYIIKPSSRFILRIGGFRSIYPSIDEFPKHQVLYTFNHNSEQDIFLVTGLGLQNNKFIFSEKTLIYIPLVISALATGTFYIPQKKHPKRRAKFFERTTQFLKDTDYSILASSEGVHDQFHGIAPFNRGIYKMAMEAELPIVPLFVHIPEGSSMVDGNYAKRATLKVELLDEISTKDWTMEYLDEHINDVRQIFVKRFNELNPTNPTT